MIEEAVRTHCERADFYKILAECYYSPDGKLLRALADFAEAYDRSFSNIIRNTPKADDLARHAVDYARLFLGPFKLLAPPYGSVYLEDGRGMGNSTLAARDVYKQEGLDLVLKDAPDHISVELEFMCYLACNEAEAREDSDLKEAARLHTRQASFLRAHLGRWIQEFARNIERNAQTEFYRALGLATRDFLLEDLGRLTGDCECGTIDP